MIGAENPSRAQALVIVDELARCGVRQAVLAPGSRSAAVAMALHEHPGIMLHVEIDERSAGFLALGIGKASGSPAAVLTTSGTATANLYPAVVEADAARIPLIALTADRPPELRATGANQTIDQVKLYGDRVRWYAEIGVAEDRAGVVGYWRSSVCRLWAEAMGVQGRAGPVHANIPTREPTVPASADGRSSAPPFTHPLDGRPGHRPWTRVQRAPRVLGDAALAELAGHISATERGLIVVGDTQADVSGVAALGRAAGWPVVAEPMAGVRGDDQVMGTAGLLLGHAGFARHHRPDLVLRFGRQGLSPAVGRFLGRDVPQILIDADGAWHDPERALADIIVADPGPTIAALAGLLGEAATAAWAGEWRQADEHVRARVNAVLDAEDGITEPRVARDVSEAVGEGGTLVVSSSMPVRDLDQFMARRPGLRVLANRGASGIDGVVSTMLGVTLGSSPVSSSRIGTARGPVVGLIGDLALLHDAGGFGLQAAGNSVDLTLVVVNNDGGGIFSFLPQAGFPIHFEPVFGTPHGRDLTHLAALHELGHVRVIDPGELGAAVRTATSAGGIRMVEVVTDRARNVEVHNRVRAAVHDELAAWG